MSKSRRAEDTDAAERIAAFNAQWESRLLQRKFEAMAHDASSFLRATAHLFFERLTALALPPSPLNLRLRRSACREFWVLFGRQPAHLFRPE
jgi:uncharacterized protein (DUF2252 family)